MARKPNFNATATGSSTAGFLLQLEGRARRAQLDHVTALERLRALDAAAVDLDAVRRAEVAHDPRAARRPYLGVLARDVRVVEHDVGVARAPERGAARAEQLGAPADPQPGGAAARVGLAQRLGDPVRRRVDHRVALLARAGCDPLVLVRPHEPRLDPELAEPQALVGLERDLGRRQQRHALAPGVFEQVAGQLTPQLVLVAGELLAVVRREPDRILVRHVRAAERLDAVLVHLARELARDLDRAHLGLEGTRERALDQAGKLGLQVAQHAHGTCSSPSAARSTGEPLPDRPSRMSQKYGGAVSASPRRFRVSRETFGRARAPDRR